MSIIDYIKNEILGLNGDEDDEMENDGYDTSSDYPTQNEDYKKNRVLNIHATAQLQVILVKPEVFSDSKQIADHLNAKKTVVLNLESTDPEVSVRISDFLAGVAYANGGSFKGVANNTFIITPYNVGFVGDDLVGELESNGVFL